MKKTLMYKISGLFLTAVLITSCGGSVEAKIAEVVTSEEVNSAGLPLEPKSTFQQDVDSIHLVVKVVDVSKETKVKTKWVFTDNFNEDGSRVDFVIDEGETSTMSDGVVHFALSKPDRGWPSGNYRVDLYLGDESESSRSVSFIVL